MAISFDRLKIIASFALVSELPHLWVSRSSIDLEARQDHPVALGIIFTDLNDPERSEPILTQPSEYRAVDAPSSGGTSLGQR